MTRSEKAAATRERNKEARKRQDRLKGWMEKEMIVELVGIAESPASTTDQKLEAMRLLIENRR